MKLFKSRDHVINQDRRVNMNKLVVTIGLLALLTQTCSRQSQLRLEATTSLPTRKVPPIMSLLN
jgi:hypothetical protein